MIKVYFNKYQFLDGEEKGVKNLDGALHADVKYVASTNNKIVVGESQEDKEDWQVFSANLKAYMGYFDAIMLEREPEEKKAEYKESTKLLEENFLVVQR